MHESLAKLIATGELASGQRLPSEGDLCRLFAVSRPVVRKALTRLRAERLVVSRKGAGSFVIDGAQEQETENAQETLATTLKALEYRRSIEPDAAYYAAIRRGPSELAAIGTALERFRDFDGHGYADVDKAFHRAIARASRNDHYERGLDLIAYDIDLGIRLAHHLSKLGRAERRLAIFAEHREIHAAIDAQDPDAARRAMLSHLDRSQLRVIARGEEMVRRTRGA